MLINWLQLSITNYCQLSATIGGGGFVTFFLGFSVLHEKPLQSRFERRFCALNFGSKTRQNYNFHKSIRICVDRLKAIAARKVARSERRTFFVALRNVLGLSENKQKQVTHFCSTITKRFFILSGSVCFETCHCSLRFP